MTLREKVLNSLERLSNHANHDIKITVERYQDVWMIRFTSGNAKVQMNFEHFLSSPKAVLEAFVEELINRG